VSALESKIDSMVEALNERSEKNALDPHTDLNLAQQPSKDCLWMPEHLLSLYGTPTYGTLTDEQKLKLSHQEFCLICSVSCFGEKEVIASIARLMLKKQFARVRSYLYYLIREENNHIYMFSEFCNRYGELYPSLYSYAQGTIWEDPIVDDLMVFVHVLVFEELGQGLNLAMSRDDDLPELVRGINRLHVEDEGRHIAFGRHLVRDLCERILPTVPHETRSQIRTHVQEYLNTLHLDYHNVRIYRSLGIKDAFDLRTELISRRDVRFFARDARNTVRLNSLQQFLRSVGLLEDLPPAQVNPSV
jgi:hypothetical protein